MITPEDVESKKRTTIPEEIFYAFDKLIVDNWRGNSSTVLLKDAIKIVRDRGGVDITEAFDKGWFDVEPYYRRAGWKVEFDKPGYCESYDAFYVFRG